MPLPLAFSLRRGRYPLEDVVYCYSSLRLTKISGQSEPDSHGQRVPAAWIPKAEAEAGARRSSRSEPNHQQVVETPI